MFTGNHASVLAIFLVVRSHQGLPAFLKNTTQESCNIRTVYSGIDDISLLIGAHMLTGVYVSLAAIIMSSRLTSASAGAAANYLMRAILIAVLSGVDPNGGKGRVWGVFWAVLLFQCMTTGLNVLRVNSYIVIALYGVILLLSVFIRTKRE